MNEDLEQYIEAHSDAEPQHLHRLERDVHLRLLYPRMCSGRYQGRLLKMLTAMIAPRRVLEIGTYAGYSALCMAEALAPGATIDTVEINEEMEDFIRRQFASTPAGSCINLIIGDIAKVAPTLKPGYDMAYIDGNKRTDCEVFAAVRPLIRPGGFVLADNTLWAGKVIDPAESHDPQTAGIIRFNEMIAADPTLEKVILPVRDGLTLIRIME